MAQKLSKSVLLLLVSSLGPDHPDVAIWFNNLGNVLREQGDLDGAKALYERAIAIDETAFGSDHLEFATLPII